MKKYSATIYVWLFVLLLFSCRPREAWNPYLHMKEKPSEQLMRENNKVITEGNKAYKKQMKKNRESISNSSNAFFKMRKHYHHGKAKKRKKTRR